MRWWASPKTKKSLLLAAVFTAAFAVSADISFENPDINAQNKVLFTVAHDVPGRGRSRVRESDAETG